MPKAWGANSAPAATSTAARPTSEWKKATSCGIGHFDAPREHGAEAAADADAEDHQQPAAPKTGRVPAGPGS